MAGLTRVLQPFSLTYKRIEREDVAVVRDRAWQSGLLAALMAAAACAGPVAEETAPAAASVSAAQETPQPPSEVFPGLFETVALSGLYEPKDWTDAVPLAPPPVILAAWEEAGRPSSGDDLALFLAEYFAPPGEVGVREALVLPEGRTLEEHVEALWPVLTRTPRERNAYGSLLPLPHPYIVPGGRFREVYYWDAYFTMTGLGPEHAAIKRDMVDNFASMIERFGFVPNANRTYYLSRSQPPFFFMMVGLLDEEDPTSALAEYLPALKAEHAFWMRGAENLAPGEAQGRVVRLEDGSLLNRYWDDRAVPRDESYAYDVETASKGTRPEAQIYRDIRAAAESGWDFSSRWFEDPEGDLHTTEASRVVPVDLNAILYGLEQAIAQGCERAGDSSCAADYAAKAEARAQAIRTHLYDEKRGVFDDYDLDARALRGRLTAAAAYPLFFGVASEEQAARTADAIETGLLARGGLLATPFVTGEQWDAPNGWAPLQWIAVGGFKRYGEEALAADLARRWTSTVARGFCESGKLVEKYDVANVRAGGGGEYPTQDGFGWTNGVTMALIRDDPDLTGLAAIPASPEAPERCPGLVAEALAGQSR
jgi:alpha,alpha-trehalase